MAVSALWQSTDGRFVLYPKTTYVLPVDEEDAIANWFLSMKWHEFLTMKSSKSKYNIRNSE
jgi:hypothetical protein